MNVAAADSPRSLLAQASALLEQNGYQAFEPGEGLDWPTGAARVFEDDLAVVAVVAFDTWDQLVDTWPDAQSELVRLISDHISAGQPKAWEGYLVLLTNGTAGTQRDPLERIRYDVSRVRKIVADAVDLEELGAIDRVLAPLLPIASDRSLDLDPPPALELLRAELIERDFAPSAIDALLAAFEAQSPVLEALDLWRMQHAPEEA